MIRWIYVSVVNILGKLSPMDVAYKAQPFVNGPVDPSVDLNTMDIAYKAQPFITYVVN